MQKTEFETWATTLNKKQVVEELVRLNAANKEQADELLNLRSDQERIKKEFYRIYEELKRAQTNMPNLPKLLAEYYINLNDLKLWSPT